MPQMIKNSRISGLLLLALLSGCISQVEPFEVIAASWIGLSITEYESVYNQPSVAREKWVGLKQKTVDFQGNIVYQFPYLPCPVFVVTDSNGMILQMEMDRSGPCDDAPNNGLK